jgi:hypothetical protein
MQMELDFLGTLADTPPPALPSLPRKFTLQGAHMVPAGEVFGRCVWSRLGGGVPRKERYFERRICMCKDQIR